MATVSFDQTSCIYPGAERPSVDNLSLAINDGEFLVLVGPSGCGKSTTLRMLAGLEDISSGRILIGNRDVTGSEPRDRDIAMVFQNYALYPHMSVRENMGFALKLAGKDKAEVSRRVEEAAKTLGLSEFLDRKPKALSGGQRQRVAMGRAIVRNPQVFLMDEPLSNLDAKLRVQTRTQIAALQRQLGVTTVYVTHDQTEAMTMGDRIAVMNHGVLQQVGTPRELYDQPGNIFVAGFIGSPAMNLAEFQLDERIARLGQAEVELNEQAIKALSNESATSAIIGFRPEAVQLSSQRPDQGGFVPLRVDVVEDLGADTYVYGTLLGSEDLGKSLVVRVAPGESPSVGDEICANIESGDYHVFSAATGLRIT